MLSRRKVARDRVDHADGGQCGDLLLSLNFKHSEGEFALFVFGSLAGRFTHQVDDRRRHRRALLGSQCAGAKAQSQPAHLMARRSVLLQPDDQRSAHVIFQGFFQLEDSFVCLAVTRMNAPECAGLSINRVRDGIATVRMVGGCPRKLEPCRAFRLAA